MSNVIANSRTLLVVVGLCHCGCNAQKQLETSETYSVEGTVTFEDGQPATGVLVSFSSLDETTNARAVTNDNGKYQIKAEKGDGLREGDYRVVVRPPINDSKPAPSTAVDAKYSNKTTSGLTTTIKPLANQYDIEVERAPAIEDSLHLATEASKEAVKSVEASVDLTPGVEPITHASDWLHRELASSDAHLICEVVDVVCDLRHGRVAFIVVDPFFNDEEDEKNNVAVLLPPESVWGKGGFRYGVDLSKEDFARLPRIKMDKVRNKVHWDDEIAAYFEDHWSAFKTSCDAPYWTPHSELPVLRRLTTLLQTSVENSQAKPLGHIVDFAIAKTESEIAYAAFQRVDGNDEQSTLYPVPLAAFVVKPARDAWILELPADILENTPTFSRDAWPTELDRGWVEYVHVRYGSAAIGGVQVKKHVN